VNKKVIIAIFLSLIALSFFSQSQILHGHEDFSFHDGCHHCVWIVFFAVITISTFLIVCDVIFSPVFLFQFLREPSNYYPRDYPPAFQSESYLAFLFSRPPPKSC